MSSKDSNRDKPEFSVIITCYFEEKTIDTFYSRLSDALKTLGRSYEIILVNDGSTDKTFDCIKTIFDKDDQVTTIIDLFRNTGQLCAMTAGINHARGKHMIFIDSDLQLDPEELPLLVAEYDKGCDIVSGFRKDRKDSLMRKIPSHFANIVMRKVSGHNISDFGCTFKIYNGSLIRAFEFGPYKSFQTAYVYSKAQKVKEVPVSHHPRPVGKSGWSVKRLFSFHIDNMIGMSQRPFQWLSVLCFIFACLFAIRIILAWIVPFSILPEITPGMLLNLLILNLLIILSVMAAIGEYVIRNYIMLQKYPIYIIRKIYQK